MGGHHPFGGQLHRIHDGLVARATAEIAPHGLADGLPVGFGILMKQIQGLHYHAGSTESALHGAGVDKGLEDIDGGEAG